MQLTRSIFVLAAVSSSALAYTLKARDNPLTVYANMIPPACTTQCAGLKAAAALTDDQFAALCTNDAFGQIVPCLQCWQSASPLDATTVAGIQTGVDGIAQNCAALGSPVSSVVVPTAAGTPTATGTGGGATAPAATATSAAGGATTPAPSSSKPPASSGNSTAATSSTRSGATSVRSNVLAGGIVALVGAVCAAML